MSKRTLNYGGYITICDTTTNMGMSSCPKDCFPYSFQSCLSDSVELNRVKQEYNKQSYQFISSPFGARWCESVSWKQFVADKVSKISQLSNNTANITGYISYSFRVNCKHGCMVRDENTYQDNECIECLRERSSVERSWERYDGEF